MKPPAFAYHRPGTVEEALALLAEHGDAKPLAGGQSLVPAMNFRLAQPAVLVDLNRLDALAGIAPSDGGVRLGAMARQRAVERSPLVTARRCWRKRCRSSRTRRSAIAARWAGVWRTPIPPPSCRR